MTGKQIVVGISDLNTAYSPDELISYALGSCIGICLYDKLQKIAGLSHILLPDSSTYKAVDNMKFADTAIKELISRMIRLGCRKNNLTAKIAGGANMFSWSGETVGDKNIKSVEEQLRIHGIPLLAKDVGGDYGRTVSICAETGVVTVKALTRGVKTL
ncbi:MAG: chemotaxis protein CheD [Clostridia bacterium]|nr:chemotaxis protein CheD [Clostridia bacterium]MDD3970851.1 chemotaxis protein CheD [Clostridia bacterium]MDD4543199.1 chemotaxis protein CheD [Clostridia bacterium]